MNTKHIEQKVLSNFDKIIKADDEDIMQCVMGENLKRLMPLFPLVVTQI